MMPPQDPKRRISGSFAFQRGCAATRENMGRWMAAVAGPQCDRWASARQAAAADAGFGGPEQCNPRVAQAGASTPKPLLAPPLPPRQQALPPPLEQPTPPLPPQQELDQPPPLP